MRSKGPYRERTGIHVEWVTVRKATLFGVAGGVLAIAAGAVYFFFVRGASQPERGSVSEETAAAVDNRARFVELTGTVKVRKAGTYEWIDARMDIALDKDDHIRTVGRSTARVRFFDGTEYLVKPDTLLVVEETREDPSTKERRVAVKLTAGQVNLQTPRRNVEGSSSQLATPTARANFEELTTADVSYDQARRVAGFAIYRGGSEVSSGSEEVRLGASEAVDVDEEKGFSPIIRLPGVPVIESPTHLSVVPAEPNTPLSWKAVEGARRYHVVLDRSPHFTDALYDSRVDGTTFIVPRLDSGTYYWQVAAIDGQNREGGFSQFAKFTVTARASTAGEPPKLLVSDPVVSLDGLVTLTGVTDPDAVVTIDNQRVSVSADGRFRHYFTLTEPGRREIVVKAYKRSGGSAEKTVYASIGSGSE